MLGIALLQMLPLVVLLQRLGCRHVLKGRQPSAVRATPGAVVLGVVLLNLLPLVVLLQRLGCRHEAPLGAPNAIPSGDRH